MNLPGVNGLNVNTTNSESERDNVRGAISFGILQYSSIFLIAFSCMAFTFANLCVVVTAKLIVCCPCRLHILPCLGKEELCLSKNMIANTLHI